MTDKRKMHQAKSNKKKNKSTNQGSPRNEFRRRVRGDKHAHPKYIYCKKGNEYEFIGITHAPITHGTRNIKLDKNPDPNKKDPSYVMPTPEVASKNDFEERKLKGWKFADSDIPKIEAVKNKGANDKNSKEGKKSKTKKSGRN